MEKLLEKVQLTKNFSLSELTASNTAKSRGIDNTPNSVQIENLKALCEQVLQPVRDKIGMPIAVNNGFRSSALNSAVGGAKTSQHLCLNNDAAADITLGSKEKNKMLFDAIEALGKYDQLIDERDFS